MMKYIFLFILMAAAGASYSQTKKFGDFEYNGDTLYFGGQKFVKGDTITLGSGSGLNKQFLFVIQQTSNMKKRVKSINNLPYQFSNTYLIFERIDESELKLAGQKYQIVQPIFRVASGLDQIEWTVQLTNAVKSGELLTNQRG